MKMLRNEWGTPKTESFNFDRISRYANSTTSDQFHKISDQTINDIDFYKLFAFVDRTISRVGQQILFKRVLRPANSPPDELEKTIELFNNNVKLREAIQFELLRLKNSDAYFISSLIQHKLVDKPKWFKFLIADIAIVILLAILSFKYPICVIILIVPMTINTLIHYWNKSNAFPFIKSFPQLSILLNVSEKIVSMNKALTNPQVRESVANLIPFRREVGFINLYDGNGIQTELSQIVFYLLELIKGFFLIEVFVFFRVIRVLESRRSSILVLYEYIGNLDVALSVASLRAGKLKTCLPDLTPTAKDLEIRNIYHPLIENCVGNDLSVRGKSVLITGSNMSGKTTFLRTLAINSILAQTINTCFADEFRSPILKQFSSIRIDDSLFDGESYYIHEVSVMHSFIAETESANQNLFVLDEVFKGTNTIERIASAKAILSYLSRKENIVIVSTHDVELSKLLEAEYDLYHFTETVDNDRIHFDHKIKSGPLRTRNAIKILALSDFPHAIVDEAWELSLMLETKS